MGFATAGKQALLQPAHKYDGQEWRWARSGGCTESTSLSLDPSFCLLDLALTSSCTEALSALRLPISEVSSFSG